MQPKFKVKVLLTQMYNKSTPCYLLTMKCAINVQLLHYTVNELPSLWHLWDIYDSATWTGLTQSLCPSQMPLTR